MQCVCIEIKLLTASPLGLKTPLEIHQDNQMRIAMLKVEDENNELIMMRRKCLLEVDDINDWS